MEDVTRRVLKFPRHVDRQEATGEASIELTAEETDAPHVIVEVRNANANDSVSTSATSCPS